MKLFSFYILTPLFQGQAYITKESCEWYYNLKANKNYNNRYLRIEHYEEPCQRLYAGKYTV